MTKEGLLVDVPESVKKKAHREIWNYTIGFVRLGKTNNHETAELLGSGILVSAKNQKVILTAQHVLEILPKKGRLGLILTVKEEKPTIDVKGLHYVKIDRGKIDTNGPDLGFVRLSVSPASTLGAVKSFYNLDKHRERLLDNPPCDHAGIWGAQGFIEQLTSTKIRNTPKTLVKGFYQYAAFGGISDYEIRGKYD